MARGYYRNTRRTRYKRYRPRRKTKRTYKRRYRRSAPYGGLGMQLGVEHKYHDTTLNTINLTSAAVSGVSTLMSAIEQGSGQSQRVGRKITAKSFVARGELSWDASGTEKSIRVRGLLVMDHHANGTAFTTSNIDEVLTSVGIDAFQKLEQNKRFSVIRDKVYTFNTTSGIAQEAITKPWKMAVKFTKPTEFIYNSTTNGETELTTNKLILIWITNATQPEACAVTGKTRLRYCDV